MGCLESTDYCKRCDKDVLIRRLGTNHIGHLILTIVTAGRWIIIGIFASIKIGGLRCSVYGRKTSLSWSG